MSFLYPSFIYFMLPIILILFFFIFTGTKKNFEMFDKDVLDKLRFESKSLSLNARYALFLTAFILMIFALAQPVIKEGEVKVEAKSADILIGIDISDSMKAEDFYPSRLSFAKNKAISLIKQAPHNRIGVIAFAKHDYIVSPLSFDHSSVAFLLSKVRTENITEKGTHLDSLLNSALAMLEHSKQKNILLFTDGGDKEDFSDEIDLAKENNLKVFVIAVASSKGSPVKSENGEFIKHNGNILISKLNPALSSLATETGGIYIEASISNADIDLMLKEIEKIAQKATLKEETIPRYTQLFYYPLGLALFFLLLAFSSFPKRKSAVGLVSVLSVLFLASVDARAGLLDFQDLTKAKEAYKVQDFNTSSKIYEDYARGSDEAVYNLANSLYKNKDYERAIKIYDEVKKPELKAKSLYNKANAHVKLKQYEEALKEYEKALKIKDDKDTKENYEAVKKFLEKKKKEKQKKKNQNKNDKKDKKKQDKDKQKSDDKKNKDSKQNKKDKQKSDDKQKKDSKKKKDSKDKEKSKNKDKKEEQKKKEEAKQKEEKKKAEQKDKGKKEKVKKGSVTKQKMSDLEAKKWLKMIKQSQQGHLYKMEQTQHKEDENEKPW